MLLVFSISKMISPPRTFVTAIKEISMHRAVINAHVNAALFRTGQRETLPMDIDPQGSVEKVRRRLSQLWRIRGKQGKLIDNVKLQYRHKCAHLFYWKVRDAFPARAVGSQSSSPKDTAKPENKWSPHVLIVVILEEPASRRGHVVTGNICTRWSGLGPHIIHIRISIAVILTLPLVIS
jgi:hypothetical protein